MVMRNHLKLGLLIIGLVVPLLSAQLVVAAEEQRAQPQLGTSDGLGPQVMQSVAWIQQLLMPEDPEDEPNLAAVKEELDDIREQLWPGMNEFEKSTVLNFYMMYYVTLEDYQGAIRSLEEILQIEELREVTRQRTQQTLELLYASEEAGLN